MEGLRRGGVGERVERRLRRHVGGEARARPDLRAHRRDVHDVPEAALPHPGEEPEHEPHRGEVVQPHRSLEVVEALVGVLERTPDRVARVVSRGSPRLRGPRARVPRAPRPGRHRRDRPGGRGPRPPRGSRGARPAGPPPGPQGESRAGRTGPPPPGPPPPPPPPKTPPRLRATSSSSPPAAPIRSADSLPMPLEAPVTRMRFPRT